ncbi:MAG: hypothetical protein F2784_11350, partial [Actinobacteria bacterium]|nr:hypothetical protein [Actinomycetota bacterium]
MTPTPPAPNALGTAPTAGRGILRTTVVGTALFTVSGLGAIVWQDSLTSLYVAISLLEFFVGMAVFA